ncbi:hypothetical protein T10_1076 [Trichinella papuae]|uniref:DUF5641 domain-containing protein n=1 Tax=Trichinella papuae TaxID=268474 RepID=A0A0V1MK32_9BILA|nr:hypothetical protein T10_1076 [Trichinella papuae]
MSVYDYGSSGRKDLQLFNPCLDNDEIQRVGGRLALADLSRKTENSMLLPHGDGVVKLLIRHVHELQLHIGMNQTLAFTRRRKKCGQRSREDVYGLSKSDEDDQPCADPSTRKVGSVRPFVHVDVDFARPILARSDGASLTIYKIYMCVFIPIQLELVPNLTVDSFLRALRQFISRRGRPKLLQSDNFRIFRLASRFLKPPFSSHSWKMLHSGSNRSSSRTRLRVRSVKVAILKVFSRSRTTADELQTVLCDIEIKINDRPLTIASDTPDHHLELINCHYGNCHHYLTETATEGQCMEKAKKASPEWKAFVDEFDDVFNGKGGAINGYQATVPEKAGRALVYALEAGILSDDALVERKLQESKEEQPRVGDIVLVVEPTPPVFSLLNSLSRRIVELHYCHDRVARSAKVQTERGLITRSVRSLVLLDPAGAV